MYSIYGNNFFKYIIKKAEKKLYSFMIWNPD